MTVARGGVVTQIDSPDCRKLDGRAGGRESLTQNKHHFE